MKVGGRYNWRGQPDRLVYLGKKGVWHQFKKLGDPRDVWCEVLTEDLRRLEETPTCVKVKVSEAIGPILDWMVASTHPWPVRIQERIDGGRYIQVERTLFGWGSFTPSTCWHVGGPIIERERICLRDTGDEGASMWEADDQREADVKFFGPTPLIAAMRCHAVSKLGEEVEVPDELG